MWFRKKVVSEKEIPEPFKAVMGMLEDEKNRWTFDGYNATFGNCELWIVNAPYADMKVNGILAPRWVAEKMRFSVGKAVARSLKGAEVDKNIDRITKLERDPRPKENHADIQQVQAQLHCAAKGHDKWEFVKKDLCFHRNSPALTGFYFKCSVCGLEITKTESELTKTQRDALAKLKLLDKEK